jgi:hypothetical protein
MEALLARIAHAYVHSSLGPRQGTPVLVQVLVSTRTPRHLGTEATAVGNNLVLATTDPVTNGSAYAELHQLFTAIRCPTLDTAIERGHARQTAGVGGWMEALHHPKSQLGRIPFYKRPSPIVFNAQHRFPVFEATFGAAECVAQIPNNLGDMLQIVQAPGGVHVYVRPGQTSPQALSDTWMKQFDQENFRDQVLAVGNDTNAGAAVKCKQAQLFSCLRPSAPAQSAAEMFGLCDAADAELAWLIGK